MCKLLAGAALARVKFGRSQLCLNTTNPAPADLLPLYNFIWSRCEVLCTFCKLSDLQNRVQTSEPQCRPFCHGVTIHFPIASYILMQWWRKMPVKFRGAEPWRHATPPWFSFRCLLQRVPPKILCHCLCRTQSHFHQIQATSILHFFASLTCKERSYNAINRYSLSNRAQQSLSYSDVKLFKR